MLIYMTTDINVIDRGFLASFEESKTLRLLFKLSLLALRITYCWMH